MIFSLSRIVVITIFLCTSSQALSAINEPISPVKIPNDINQKKMELGKKLFFDPRLSKSGFISCNSCHNLSMGGTDNIQTSIGHNWQQGPINSPTVLNASMNVAQFWDGRAADLKEQAAGPIANPGEMAFTHTLAVDVLQSIPQYVSEFNAIYKKKSIDIDQVTDAIAEFEKTLVTPNSRFDQWLEGDEQALSKQELTGYKLFKTKGCIGCHNGPAVGGNSFQKMGLVKAYATSNPAEGLKSVTGKHSDQYKFKVPTLRNIELTYPYFHDGAADTLSEAVDVMARIQLGINLTKNENENLVAFLKTLTGEQPSFSLPRLPPSTAKTPKPVPFDE